ncbi:hypothetical protein [Cryptosporangium sp. NPDC051539]|uniref:hypothetical protein n=1 Tax=Cryptosporangium sp. NPDC051539 TaxID=3363962 RepID=UPI00379537CB
MTWLAWRQQRIPLVAAAVVIAVYATAANGHPPWVARLLGEANDFGEPVYVLALGFGACWAAPLLAREQQLGTIDFAYSQSVSRLRWVLTRTASVFLVAAATTLGVVAAVRWLWTVSVYAPAPLQFVQAPGLIAAVLLAVAIGFGAGAVLGRTVRAMAATVAGFFVVVVGSNSVYLTAMARGGPIWDEARAQKLDLYLAAGHLVLASLCYAGAVVWMIRRVPEA